jgi:Uncharacterized protein required for formate dehydrogenase activity
MCGKVDMDLFLPINNNFSQQQWAAEDILPLFIKMRNHQSLFKQTGGCHAAAIFDKNGKLLTVKEDIGRHNAVDKAIGQLLLDDTLSVASCLLVSGRVSYEIVSKCYKAGIGTLAAVSAPSTLAVTFCKEHGMQLFAFCRENRATQYA